MMPRSLRRAKLYTAAVVASLAVSIGAATTAFATFDAVLLRALPWRDQDRLVWVSSVRTTRADGPFTLPEYLDYRDAARTLDLAAYTSWSGSLSAPAGGRRLQGMRISANAFDVLGAAPSAGRLFRPADDAPDAPRVVLLSHSTWLSMFGGSDSAVGATIRLNGEPHQIVGVLAAEFPLTIPGLEVAVPLRPDLDPRRTLRSSTNFLRVVGRIRPSATAGDAQQELTQIARDLKARFPVDYATKLDARAHPLKEYLVGGTRQGLFVILAAALLLFGIAVVNVLNLTLVRAMARRGEVAVRRALGAARAQLAMRAFGEGAWLAGAGAAGGLLLAFWALAVISRLPLSLPRLGRAGIDARVLAFALASATVVAVLIGAFGLPGRRDEPQLALRASGRGQSAGRAQARMRMALLGLQLAFAVHLTIVTATMARSLAGLERVELGFDPDSVFVAQIALPPTYRSPAEVARFATAFHSALTAAPGVQSAGFISIGPLSGLLAAVPFHVVGGAQSTGENRTDANFRWVTADYFGTIGARIVHGRGFTAADDSSGPRVAVVSEALASKYFPNGDAVGREVEVNDNNTGPRPLLVVGVVRNMRHVTIEGAAPDDIYIPLAQGHPDGTILLVASQFWAVRAGAHPERFAATFARTLASVERDAAVGQSRSLRAFIDGYLAPRSFSVASLMAFAVVAFVLAVLGVFGTVTYAVQQRRRELGLRLALGATPRGIVGHVLAPAVSIASCGAAVGIVAALVSRQAIAGLLFGVSPTDPATIVGASLLLVAASALAAFLPARRAGRIAPVSALSGE